MALVLIAGMSVAGYASGSMSGAAHVGSPTRTDAHATSVAFETIEAAAVVHNADQTLDQGVVRAAPTQNSLKPVSFPAAATPAAPAPASAKVVVKHQSAPAVTGYGCGPALAYLSAHAAPGFTFQCPGNAFGAQAMTCVNHAPQCAGEKIIAISVPCAAAYMNEASNSWVLMKLRSGPIDPYGYCH